MNPDNIRQFICTQRAFNKTVVAAWTARSACWNRTMYEVFKARSIKRFKVNER